MTEQQKNLIRQLLMMGGSSLATWLITKGILTQEQVSFLSANAPALIGLAMMVGGSLWSFIARKQTNMIASVAAMTDIKPSDQAVLAATVAELPAVSKVETAPTAAGVALAAAAPSASVVPAGS